MSDRLIVPASVVHIEHIAQNMREADRREVWASHRHTPLQALAMGLAYADKAWCCLVDDKPAFMWGVSRYGSILAVKGSPWLLGTDAILKVQREFLRQSRGYVEQMQTGFERLENFVHVDNRISIRWLKWCGFKIEDKPTIINGENFYMFWRNK